MPDAESELAQAVALLDDIVVRLAALAEAAPAPQGLAISVATTFTTSISEEVFSDPLFTIQVINDDVTTLNVWINEIISDPIQVRQNENVELKFPVPIIKRVFAQGRTASVAARIIGTF